MEEARPGGDAPNREAKDLARPRRLGDEVTAELGLGDDKVEDGRKVEQDGVGARDWLSGRGRVGLWGGRAGCGRQRRGAVGVLERVGAGGKGRQGGRDAALGDLVHHSRAEGRVEDGCGRGAASQLRRTHTELRTHRRSRRRAWVCTSRSPGAAARGERPWPPARSSRGASRLLDKDRADLMRGVPTCASRALLSRSACADVERAEEGRGEMAADDDELRLTRSRPTALGGASLSYSTDNDRPAAIPPLDRPPRRRLSPLLRHRLSPDLPTSVASGTSRTAAFSVRLRPSSPQLPLEPLCVLRCAVAGEPLSSAFLWLTLSDELSQCLCTAARAGQSLARGPSTFLELSRGRTTCG